MPWTFWPQSCIWVKDSEIHRWWFFQVSRSENMGFKFNHESSRLYFKFFQIGHGSYWQGVRFWCIKSLAISIHGCGSFSLAFFDISFFAQWCELFWRNRNKVHQEMVWNQQICESNLFISSEVNESLWVEPHLPWPTFEVYANRSATHS